MTSGIQNNAYIVGVQKKPIPTIGKARLEQAIASTAQHTKK